MTDSYLATLTAKMEESRKIIEDCAASIEAAKERQQAEVRKLDNYDTAGRIYKEVMQGLSSNGSTDVVSGLPMAANGKRRAAGSVKRVVLSSVAEVRPTRISSAQITEKTGLPSDTVRPAVKDAKERGDLTSEVVDGVHLYGISQQGLLYLEHEAQKEQGQKLNSNDSVEAA